MAQATSLHAALTVRQHETLEAIDMLQRRTGYSPTVREIQDAMCASSPSNIHNRLIVLREFGYVTWVEDSPRTLVVTRKGRKAL